MIKKQIKSFKRAFSGIWYAIRDEAHMRFHIAAAGFVIIMGALYNLAPDQWSVLAVTIASVMALELVNTAIERLCNLYTTEIHPVIKIIKDVSAGAVLIAAIGSVAVGICIFLNTEKIAEVFLLLIENPLLIFALVLYAALSVAFVLKLHPKQSKTKK